MILLKLRQTITNINTRLLRSTTTTTSINRNYFYFYNNHFNNNTTTTTTTRINEYKIQKEQQELKVLSSSSSTILLNQPFFIQKRFKKGKQEKGGGGGGGGSGLKKPKVELSNEELNSVFNYQEMINDMNNTVKQLKDEYANKLALKLNPTIIEELNIKTNDGSVLKLGEVSQVVAKSPNLYIIDMINAPQYVQNVVDTLHKSTIFHNLNAQVDKTNIFLNIPKLTREHRENLSKSAKQIYENVLKKLRDIHTKHIRKTNDNKKISRDLSFSLGEHIKYQFDLHASELEKIKNAKQNELLALEVK